MTLLLLGGTREARILADRLHRDGIRATVSLAGVTSDPLPLALPARHGGFGGETGLAAYLRAEGTSAVIDATHPFAAVMPWTAQRVAQVAGLPRLRLLRPEWPARAGWRAFRDLPSAIAALPAGARCFATTGLGSAPHLAARPDCTVWLRSIEDPGPLPGHIHPVRGRPPFALEAEIDALRTRRITHLLTKNSGGPAEKLAAADNLGLATWVVARPPTPPGPVVATVDQAVAWARGIVAKNPG